MLCRVLATAVPFFLFFFPSSLLLLFFLFLFLFLLFLFLFLLFVFPLLFSPKLKLKPKLNLNLNLESESMCKLHPRHITALHSPSPRPSSVPFPALLSLFFPSLRLSAVPVSVPVE